MYYTQRDNKIDPHGTCNVTSYAMAARRAGCLWSYADGAQPEDVLAKFLLSKDAQKHMRKVAPWAFGKRGRMVYKPYEVHAMLAWGYNELTSGHASAEFGTQWSLTELVYLQAQGAGVVVSGNFPHYRLKTIGHIVCLAGVEYTGSIPESPADVDFEKIEALIIDDPYGDYKSGYDPRTPKYREGAGVRMSREDFVRILKNKTKETGYWAHVIMKKAMQ